MMAKKTKPKENKSADHSVKSDNLDLLRMFSGNPDIQRLKVATLLYGAGSLSEEELYKAIGSGLVPKVTKQELKQCGPDITELIKKFGLTISARDKYGQTDEFEIFKYNFENLEKLKITLDRLYELFHNVSESMPELVEEVFGEYNPYDSDERNSDDLEDEGDDFDEDSSLDDSAKDLKECRPLINEQLFVQAVQILEIYLDDILKIIYNRKLEDLIIDDKENKFIKLKYDEILKFKNLGELRNFIIDAEVNKLKTWSKRIGFFKDSKIDFDKSGFTIAELSMLVERRNLIMHRKGIVDKFYLDKTKDKTYKLQEKVNVTDDMVGRALDNTFKLAGYIDKKVLKPFV